MISLLLSLLLPSTGAASAAGSGKFVAESRISAVHDSAALKKIHSLNAGSKLSRMSKRSSSGGKSPFQAEKTSAAQEAAKQGASSVQNFVPQSDSGKEITVIVELQTQPEAVYDAKVKQGLAKADRSFKSALVKEQSAFSAAAVKTLNVKIDRTYSKVFNGFALKIAANNVERLALLPGVKAIYPSHTMKADPVETVAPNTNFSGPHIGAGSYWNNGYDGSGIKVGVIDTGVDYNHPSLKGAYKGGYDFVDNDADPKETPPDPNDPEAATYHGTHVSGIAVGRGNPDNPNSPTGWVRGVAPGADLYVYRVLGPGGSGSEENVIAGVEQAVNDGLDVINLSLGSDTNDQNSADAIALNNAVLAGVVVVASNGNNGPNDFTTGTPAASEMAISVGASTAPGSVGLATGVSSVTGSTYYNVQVMASNTASDYRALANHPLDLVYVGLGYPADYQGKDLTGKIAFIKRGELAFVDKIANAKKAGAVAAIIFNRDDQTGLANVLLNDSLDYIPTFDMKGTDGRALLAALKAAGTGNFTLTGFDSYQTPGDLLADFSSRGPSLPGLEIKPDITAPGVAIRSSVPAYDGNYQYAYEYLDGTSMAAPHVAGAAALVLDKQPTLLPDEVKSLLMNNATQLENANHQRYSVMAQGAGRVNLNSSLTAKAVALVRETNDAVRDGVPTDYHTGSISYGNIAAGQSVSRTVDVKDIAGAASSYTVSTAWFGASAGSLAASAGSIQVAPGGTSQFNVVLTVPANTANGRYEGEVTLTEAGGSVLTIPVAVYVGQVTLPDTISNISLTPNIFSPNGDTSIDTSDVKFKVNLDNDYISLDVFDATTGDWVGYITEEAGGLNPGSYVVSNWSGVVSDYDRTFTLPDGFYVVAPYYGDAKGEYLLENQAKPFVVDTHAPVSTVSDRLDAAGTSGTIKGQIASDFLVDLFGDYLDIGVAAVYEENGAPVQADGTIAADGSFQIPVPVHPGDNRYEVYVYDSAGNGLIAPAHVVQYTQNTTPQTGVSAQPSASKVNTGDAFTVDVHFTDVQDLYSAQFSLTYDPALTKGTVTPSVTLATYQQQHNPSAGLIVSETTHSLGNGLVRSDYIVSLAGEFSGYSGSGTLATFTFGAVREGTYSFNLSSIRFLGSSGQEIAPGTVSNGTVIVNKGGTTPTEHVITGSINAQGFGAGVAYNDVWYNGADGKLQVVVEAVDAHGAVVKLGTVNANGTYSLSVPEGTYTIRVVVPGHIGSEASVTVDKDKTLNFGPLTAGDVNEDGLIDLADLNQAARAFGKLAPWSTKAAAEADINRDGSVNLLDVSFILTNYGIGQ